MNSRLGTFIKTKREDLKLSRSEFVKQMPKDTRISTSTLGQIENGKIKRPPDNRLKGFAKVLKVKIEVCHKLLVSAAISVSVMTFMMPKEANAIEMLKSYEPDEGYHLAFSGGKDSCVIKFLAQKAGVRFKAHMALTTVDPPEIIKFNRTYHSDLIYHKPKYSMFKLISEVKMSLPTRISRWCCEHLKEYVGTAECVVQGIRGEESYDRSQRTWFEYDTRPAMAGKSYVNPILDWTEQDVWKYLKHYNIPYSELYKQGFGRIGCVGCPMATGKNKSKEFLRYPRYKNMYLKAIRIAQTKLNKKGEYYAIKKHFKNEEDAFNWWLSDKSIKDYQSDKKFVQLKLDM